MERLICVLTLADCLPNKACKQVSQSIARCAFDWLLLLSQLLKRHLSGNTSMCYTMRNLITRKVSWAELRQLEVDSVISMGMRW